jgi:CubicO group peptidase (beta-lactamase class C family)
LIRTRLIVTAILAFAGSLSAIPQRSVTAWEGSPTERHINGVENNLAYYATIQNLPNASMNLVMRMSELYVPGLSIAMIHSGKLEWARGYGVASVGGPLVTPNTIFGAASISKPLVAMAVLRFVQDGKIDLDTDVNQYLKGWKIPDNQYTASKKVTVRELLNHISGIGTHNGWVFDPTKDQIPTLLQMLDGVKPAQTVAVRVEAVPGTRFAYANGGFLVLQLLLTEVGGKPFPQVMQETVLGPLDMTSSTYEAPLPQKLVSRAATCYNGTKPIAPEHFMSPDAAAGGLWTTPTDLSKFVIELQKEYAGSSHLILNQASARQMLQAGMGPNPKRHFGLGVEIGGSPNDQYFEHSGSGYWETEMIGYLNGDGIIIMSSGGGGALLIQEIARSAATVYDWPDYQPIAKSIVQVDPSAFGKFVGVYDFITVTKDGDKLMAEIPKGGPLVQLYPESATEYFLRDSPTEIKFDFTEQGNVEAAEFITPMVHWTIKKKQ